MAPPASADAGYRRHLRRARGYAERLPGSQHALTTLHRDRRAGGGLLAGALAFRLFAVLLPMALLLAVGLGYASTLDRASSKTAGEAVGIADATMESIAQASKLSATSRWLLAASATFALLYAAASAAKAAQAAHSLAWKGYVDDSRRPLASALALIAAIVAIGVIWGLVGRARATLGPAPGLLVILVAAVPFAAVWLAVSCCLPHGDAPWRALLPGAVLMGVGLEVIQVATVLFIAGKVERASSTYGPLGAAFTILAWLFIISRVVVASAMLNAVLWSRHQGRAAAG
jgi:uncharacterized BrkB/YihY/UPF0761 family membrane protein